MHPDLSLLNAKRHGLCEAIEKDGSICFNKKASKYCWKHYERLKKYGSFNLPPKQLKRCRFIDCDEKHYCKGACKKHYRGPKNWVPTKKCEVNQCDNFQKGHGLCGTHLLRLKKYGDVDIVNKSGFNKGWIPPWTGKRKHEKCIVPGCNIKNGDQKRKLVKGLCGMHYCRWIRHGNYYVTLINRDKNNVSNTKLMD